jgi:hypothetical protein
MAVGVWKGLETALRLVGRLLGLLRKIPVVDDVVGRAQRTFLNPIVIKLVRDPDDPDLDVALDLYRKRIPDDQQFEPADIVRWIREDQVRRQNNISSDWFLVAKYRRRVSGFLLFHYVRSAELAFFAYMVTANTPGIAVNAVSRALASAVARLLKKRKELRGCRGFALEVEDPRWETGRRRDESLARIRRFCTLAEMQGFSLRAFDTEYKQPKLSLEDLDNTERPLLLLSARTRHTELGSTDHRSEVEEVLRFIYTNIYPEGYSFDQSENLAYRDYCARLLDTETAKLPPEVRSLSCAQLIAQVGKGKQKKAVKASL